MRCASTSGLINVSYSAVSRLGLYAPPHHLLRLLHLPLCEEVVATNIGRRMNHYRSALRTSSDMHPYHYWFVPRTSSGLHPLLRKTASVPPVAPLPYSPLKGLTLIANSPIITPKEIAYSDDNDSLQRDCPNQIRL